MTSREEVAIAADHWAARCAKVDTLEENALRDLAANASSDASSASKLSLWFRSRYASRCAPLAATCARGEYQGGLCGVFIL